jgi:hypothetical protein
MELSSVNSVCPYKPNIQKYTTIASEEAMKIHPRYTLTLNPPFLCPFVYSSGTASNVLAAKSFSNTPMKITGSEVNNVLNILKLQDS